MGKGLMPNSYVPETETLGETLRNLKTGHYKVVEVKNGWMEVPK